MTKRPDATKRTPQQKPLQIETTVARIDGNKLKIEIVLTPDEVVNAYLDARRS